MSKSTIKALIIGVYAAGCTICYIYGLSSASPCEQKPAKIDTVYIYNTDTVFLEPEPEPIPDDMPMHAPHF